MYQVRNHIRTSAMKVRDITFTKNDAEKWKFNKLLNVLNEIIRNEPN